MLFSLHSICAALFGMEKMFVRGMPVPDPCDGVSLAPFPFALFLYPSPTPGIPFGMKNFLFLPDHRLYSIKYESWSVSL